MREHDCDDVSSRATHLFQKADANRYNTTKNEKSTSRKTEHRERWRIHNTPYASSPNRIVMPMMASQWWIK